MTNADALNRTLFIADNLDVLRGIDSGSIDLIATDPPFNKGVTAFTGITKAGATVSYKDVWSWGDVQQEWADRIRADHRSLHGVIMAANATHSEGMGAFLCWLGVRVLEMHRVLAPTGSLYLHCDDTASPYIRQMLDAIFGAGQFRTEIIWRRSGAHSDTRQGRAQHGRVHDVILFYAKGERWTWNPTYTDYDPEYVRTAYRHVEPETGRRYRLDNMTGPGGAARGNPYYEVMGVSRHWRFSKERMAELIAEGRVVQSRPGTVPAYKRYLDEMPGVPLQDVWEDLRPIGSGAKERTGYPTQKPLALYQRIIKASSNPGDLVLDPFAGCATTCVAAEGLQRRWIGIDINEEAGEVLRSRLQLTNGNGGNPVRVLTEPPVRTDDGEAAAPELVLVGQRPRERSLSARELREQLILMDGRKCQGCGWVPHHAEYLEADHKVPKSRGGSDDIRNRVLLCGPCNGAKSNKLTLAELRERRIEENRMEDPSWTREWYERTGRFA